MTRVPSFTGQFKRDVKLVEKRGKDLAKLRRVMSCLIASDPLPRVLRDHALIGTWKHARDLHLEPDWLLIYSADAEWVRFERTGSHADLFG